MTTTFANASQVPACPAAPARRQWVEALVTVATLAWFGAALASMSGELHPGRSASSSGTEATGGMPAAAQASMGRGSPAQATICLI